MKFYGASIVLSVILGAVGLAKLFSDRTPNNYSDVFVIMLNSHSLFASSNSFESAAHMNLHEEIIGKCANAVYPSLSRKALDAKIGLTLDRLPIAGKLSVGDINTALGGPIQTKETPAELRCLIALNIYFTRFPESWNLIFSGSENAKSVRPEIETLLEQGSAHRELEEE
jgi:hypothetical protein